MCGMIIHIFLLLQYNNKCIDDYKLLILSDFECNKFYIIQNVRFISKLFCQLYNEMRN